MKIVIVLICSFTTNTAYQETEEKELPEPLSRHNNETNPMNG